MKTAQSDRYAAGPGRSTRSFHRAAVAALLAVVALTAGPAWCAPFNFYTLPDTFIDDQAKPVHLSEWKGKPLILTMEYSACRFMCSTTFSKMKAIQEAADQQHIAIDFVIVSLDPKNDTPEAWRQYRVNREIERSNWHLLTGSEETTKRFARLLGVNYWYMDDNILHDLKIARLNEQGEVEKEITDLVTDPSSLLKPP